MGNNLGPFPSALDSPEGQKQGVGAVSGGGRTTYWSEIVTMVLNMLETK